MKATSTPEKVRKAIKGEDQVGTKKKVPAKSKAKKSMKDKGMCSCLR